MNSEKFKSIILAALFILSIFLTNKLFIEVPSDISWSFAKEETIKKENYIISDIFSPERYIINYSKDNHTVLYSDKSYPIWVESKNIIKEALNNSDIVFNKISYEEFSKYSSLKSIGIQFSQNIDTKVFTNMIDVKNKKQVYNKLNNIREIYINLGETPFLVISNENDYIQINNINIKTEKLNKIVNEIKEDKYYVTYYNRRQILGTDKDVYGPHTMKNIPYYIYVLNQLDIYDEIAIENLVERFFDKDINYVKRVIENDANIYMYDDEKIIVSDNGVLEYYNAIEQTISSRDYFKSIKTALDFMIYKDQLPNDLYLISAEEIESNSDKGYRFIFGYRINEIPILMSSDVSDNNGKELKGPIEIEVYNDYVRSYKSHLRNVQTYKNKSNNIKEIQGPINHIASNLKTITRRYMIENEIEENVIDIEKYRDEILASVKDVKLAYYDTGNQNSEQKLISVWVVDIGKTTYIFDIENEIILNGKDLR